MKIVVINGSPKSNDSVTMQYVKYLENKFDDVDFETINVGKYINKLEKNEEFFLETMDKISGADGLIWAYPVYVLLVPYQLKRFMEMIVERGMDEVLSGIYATSISTSAHFYDQTAHDFMHASSEDMGMRYRPGYSAAMYDLTETDKRKNFILFFQRFLHYIENDIHTPRRYPQLKEMDNVFLLDPGSATPLKHRGNIVVLTDARDEDENLRQMIDAFVKRAPAKVNIYNLNDIEIRGGCLGCIMCAYDGQCVYKDDFEEFVRDKVNVADALVYAGRMDGRYLSSRWKLFFDRSFFNGHRPVNMGKQIGFLISGPLSQNGNLDTILKAIPEVGMMNMVDIVTDESQDPMRDIERMAQDMCWGMENRFVMPDNFLGVGGHKVFRDLIYNMGFIFRADHRYYKQKGLYDFPQKDYKARMMNIFLGPLLTIPQVRKGFMDKAKEGMLMPFQKVMDK